MSGEILRQGSRGDEVRRLQKNLNAAIGRRHGLIDEDGKFGRGTKQAVENFQQDFRLKSVDGIVGPKTRAALATRVLVIEGQMARDNSAGTPGPVGPPQAPSAVPKTGPNPPGPPAPAADPPPPESRFLFQVQPAFGLTPPPFASRSPGASPAPPGPPTLVAGQIAFGLVYRTATEGPHWEFGGAFQSSFNSRSQVSDPRYTLQVQGSVTYADPISFDRFHTALFTQVVGLQNLGPSSTILGAQLGVQLSLDIIADRWSLFSQAAVAGQWTLHDSGGAAGALSFGPQFTVLGTTIQWGL